MAILYDEKTSTHTIKKGGVVIDTLAPTRFESVLSDRALEADLRADLESKASLSNRASVVLMHIVSRDPLHYVLRVAPPGHVPAFTNWWEEPADDSEPGAGPSLEGA